VEPLPIETEAISLKESNNFKISRHQKDPFLLLARVGTDACKTIMNTLNQLNPRDVTFVKKLVQMLQKKTLILNV
jgi:hypothetical protein